MIHSTRVTTIARSHLAPGQHWFKTCPGLALLNTQSHPGSTNLGCLYQVPMFKGSILVQPGLYKDSLFIHFCFFAHFLRCTTQRLLQRETNTLASLHIYSKCCYHNESFEPSRGSLMSGHVSQNVNKLYIRVLLINLI